MAKLASKVYGDALFELAAEENRMDEFWQESGQFCGEVLTDNDFKQLMNHPKIVKEEKVKIVEAVMKGHFSAEMTGFVRLVIEKDHFAELGDIFAWFEGRVKDYKKIGIVTVETPFELKPEQKRAIEGKILATAACKSLEMNYQVDESLMGGMRIRMKDRVIDSTLKTKLGNLTKDLMKVPLSR